MAHWLTYVVKLGLLFHCNISCLGEHAPQTQSNQSVCLQLCELQGTQCYVNEGILMMFHMTPVWLEAHASYINGGRTTTALQMTFNTGSEVDAALLKIPLITAGHMDDSELLTVEIIVAHDISIGNTVDSDIRYGVSDGTRFVGFQVVDSNNFKKLSPCYGVEGSSGLTLTQTKYGPSTPKTGDQSYPGQFVLTLKLNERWGSCYTAHDGGFTRETGYENRLTLSKGLNLEVYKSDKGEKVGIKYIKVIIIKDA